MKNPLVLLHDELLLCTYKRAVELSLEEDFVYLLETEIKERNLNETSTRKLIPST